MTRRPQFTRSSTEQGLLTGLSNSGSHPRSPDGETLARPPRMAVEWGSSSVGLHSRSRRGRTPLCGLMCLTDSTGFLFSPLPVLADTSHGFIWRLLLPSPAPTDTLMSPSLRPLSDLSPPCSGVGDTGVDHIVVLGRGASFSGCAVHEVYEQCK